MPLSITDLIFRLHIFSLFFLYNIENFAQADAKLSQVW